MLAHRYVADVGHLVDHGGGPGGPDPEDASTSAPDRPGRADIAARVAFVVGLVVAVPVIVHTNRDQWFFLDDWDFLVTRSLRSPTDLLEPHNEHWSTLPIVLYRLVFAVVGIEHYGPYQALVVVAHLSAAALLWCVLRRVVRFEWVATAVALVFAFLGTGRTNIGWGFQVGFSGALALGLAHLLLADHDPGPIRRRDLAGIGCGLLALTCSAIGVVMVVVVGVAVLVRRGWRAAALHTIPLLAVFGAWYLAYGRDAESTPRPTLRLLVRFLRWGAWDLLVGLGRFDLGAVLVVLVGAAGVVAIAVSVRRPGGRSRYASVIGTGVGAAVLLVLTGFGRAGAFPSGPGLTPDRYLHLLAALGLPVVAVGADRLIGRWRWSAVPLALLVVVSFVGNVRALTPRGGQRYILGEPMLVGEMARLAGQRPTVPDALRPDPFGFDGLTVGWLRAEDAQGRVPHPGPVPPAIREKADLRLSLQQIDPGESLPSCAPVPFGRAVPLAAGDIVRVGTGAVSVTRLRDAVPVAEVSYLQLADAKGSVALRAVGPLTVVLRVAAPDATAERCR